MRLVQALLLMVVILALVNVASTATSWTTPGEHTHQNVIFFININYFLVKSSLYKQHQTTLLDKETNTVTCPNRT